MLLCKFCFTVVLCCFDSFDHFNAFVWGGIYFILETRFRFEFFHNFHISIVHASVIFDDSTETIKKPKKGKLKHKKKEGKTYFGKLCGSKEVMMEVAEVNDGGDIKLNRALEIGEASLPFLTTLQPHSHYNALLFLHKNVFLFLLKA